MGARPHACRTWLPSQTSLWIKSLQRSLANPARSRIGTYRGSFLGHVPADARGLIRRAALGRLGLEAVFLDELAPMERAQHHEERRQSDQHTERREDRLHPDAEAQQRTLRCLPR